MKKKLTKHFDRIIMGAIIGGAIGSVIGSKLGKNSQTNEISTNSDEPHKKKGLLRRLLGL